MRQWEAWDCSRDKVFKVFCYVISVKRSLFAAQSFSYDSLVMCVCQKLVQALIFFLISNLRRIRTGFLCPFYYKSYKSECTLILLGVLNLAYTVASRKSKIQVKTVVNVTLCAVNYMLLTLNGRKMLIYHNIPVNIPIKGLLLLLLFLFTNLLTNLQYFFLHVSYLHIWICL